MPTKSTFTETETTALGTFESDRILGRRLLAADFPFLDSMHRDPKIMTAMGTPTWSEDETRAMLARHLAHWDRFGYGTWILFCRQSGERIGRGGIRRSTIQGIEEYELHYMLKSEYWGQGLATEFVNGVSRLAFESLASPSVAAWTLPTNHASRRVLEKAHFLYEKDITWAGLPHQLFRRQRNSPTSAESVV